MLALHPRWRQRHGKPLRSAQGPLGSEISTCKISAGDLSFWILGFFGRLAAGRDVRKNRHHPVFPLPHVKPPSGCDYLRMPRVLHVLALLGALCAAASAQPGEARGRGPAAARAVDILRPCEPRPPALAALLTENAVHRRAGLLPPYLAAAERSPIPDPAPVPRGVTAPVENFITQAPRVAGSVTNHRFTDGPVRGHHVIDGDHHAAARHARADAIVTAAAHRYGFYTPTTALKDVLAGGALSRAALASPVTRLLFDDAQRASLGSAKRANQKVTGSARSVTRSFVLGPATRALAAAYLNLKASSFGSVEAACASRLFSDGPGINVPDNAAFNALLREGVEGIGGDIGLVRHMSSTGVRKCSLAEIRFVAENSGGNRNPAMELVACLTGHGTTRNGQQDKVRIGLG
jgi:hypothetical protein